MPTARLPTFIASHVINERFAKSKARCVYRLMTQLISRKTKSVPVISSLNFIASRKESQFDPDMDTLFIISDLGDAEICSDAHMQRFAPVHDRWPTCSCIAAKTRTRNRSDLRAHPSLRGVAKGNVRADAGTHRGVSPSILTLRISFGRTSLS